MFTGIIENLCSVKAINFVAGSARLTIDLADSAKGVNIGDSIAINGICLTASQIRNTDIAFDVSTETIAMSAIKNLKPTSRVNIEKAMLANARFGGHFVSGHIDGTASITAIDKKDNFATFTFTAEKKLLENIIPKGSVAIDGISLTVANLTDKTFSIAVIPETIKRTTLGTAKLGDKVNIENDIIVKTIRKQVSNLLPADNNMTIEKLREMGF